MYHRLTNHHGLTMTVMIINDGDDVDGDGDDARDDDDDVDDDDDDGVMRPWRPLRRLWCN